MKRHLSSSPFCPLYETMVETTAHHFFKCYGFEHIWKAHHFYLKLPDTMMNFGAWLRWCRGKLDGKVFILAGVSVLEDLVVAQLGGSWGW